MFVNKGLAVVRVDLIARAGPESEAGAEALGSSGRNMIFNSFSRVIHGVRRLLGFFVCVISIVPGGAEARMRPIVSFYSKISKWKGRAGGGGEGRSIRGGRYLRTNWLRDSWEMLLGCIENRRPQSL